MTNIFALLLLSTTSWLVTAQETQGYQPLPTLSPDLQVPSISQTLIPYSTPQTLNLNQFLSKQFSPSYEVQEISREAGIQTTIIPKFQIQPLLSRSHFRPSVSSIKPDLVSVKFPNTKPIFHNKKKAQHLLKFPSIRGLTLSPLTPTLQPQLHNLPRIQSAPLQLQEPLQPPMIPYDSKAIFNGEYPVPSEDLQVPSTDPWNPKKDPNLYYKLPPSLTKIQTPTNAFPKKYNSEVHQKNKPVSNKPKQQFDLYPITSETLAKQQKENQKTLQNYEKNQNKKEQNKVQENKPKPIVVLDDNTKTKDPVAEESNGFSQGFDADGEVHNIASLEAVSDSHEIDSSKSINPSEKPAPKDRVEFQMHGFDGPLSYKWGFDTGGGRNRHFRYEERDKFGHVKGHYGYYDRRGKLRMVHYNANPLEGFKAETENFGKNSSK